MWFRLLGTEHQQLHRPLLNSVEKEEKRQLKAGTFQSFFVLFALPPILQLIEFPPPVPGCKIDIKKKKSVAALSHGYNIKSWAKRTEFYS